MFRNFRNNGVIALAALCISLAPASVLAEGPGADYARPGYYIAVGAGAAINTGLEDALQSLEPSANVGTSANFGVRVGARMLSRFAQELDLEVVGAESSALGTKAGEVDEVTMTANARVYLLTGRFQPYALFGLGFMSATVTDELGLGFSVDATDFALRVGGGLEMYLNENVFADVGVAYLTPFAALDSLDYISVRASVGYKF